MNKVYLTSGGAVVSSLASRADEACLSLAHKTEIEERRWLILVLRMIGRKLGWSLDVGWQGDGPREIMWSVGRSTEIESIEEGCPMV